MAPEDRRISVAYLERMRWHPDAATDPYLEGVEVGETLARIFAKKLAEVVAKTKKAKKGKEEEEAKKKA